MFYVIRNFNILHFQNVTSNTVQLNLNFTHACRYMSVLAHLTHAKVKKLACACTVAHDFSVCMRDSKHTRHTRDAHHELAFGLPHYTCCFAADWLLYML